MGRFHPVSSMVFTRNRWLLLLSKIELSFKLSPKYKNNLQNSKDSKSVLIFSLAVVVVEI